MASKTIGFTIYIQLPTQVKKTPVVQSIVNNFDYHGDIVSLRRLDGESNVDYRNRVFDVTVHRGGPDYEGILNNIGRELGYLRQKAITIELKLHSDGSPVASNPRVDILANKVVLYSDWRPNGTAVIDRTIRFYQLNDTGYYLMNLISAINESPYFMATIETGIRRNLHSFLLVRGTSDRIIVDDYIRADKFQQLQNTYIIENSLSFAEKGIFDEETTSSPTNEGEYYVDYTSGTIESFDLPSGDGTCSYHYADFPMEIDYLPLQIFTLQDDNFQYELFDKETLDSGSSVDALPNEEGAEIYHQLFMNTKVFWGE